MATIDNRPRIWAERFEIVRKLGTGGMGEVWLARDLEMNGVYAALKFVRRELGSDTRAVNDLRREVANARTLTHDRVVRVHELMKYGETYFITMEYVKGEDLNTRLGRYQQEGRNSDLEEVLAVARDVCAAVDYAHSLKVLHLDLKPSNVVAMAAGGYKVMDFGIARAAQESMTRVSRAAGYTGGYAAPEQILGKPVDRRTDVYGLAATFYDLLAGRVPCATDYATVNVPPEPLPGVPAYANAALLKALAKDPGGRFPTAAAFAGALRGERPPAAAEPVKAGASERAAVNGTRRRVGVSALTKTPLSPKKAGRRKWLWFILAGAAAAVIIIAYPHVRRAGSNRPLGESVAATAAHTAETPLPAPLPEAEARVLILNNTKVPQRYGNALAALEEFNQRKGNVYRLEQSRPKVAAAGKTSVYFRPGFDGQAQELSKTLGATVPCSRVDITVTSGQDISKLILAAMDKKATGPVGASVEVLNGAGIEGAGAKMRERLEANGYGVVAVGNAASLDYKRTVIEAPDNGKDAAVKLASLFGLGPEAVERATWDIKVVVGDDYGAPPSEISSEKDEADSNRGSGASHFNAHKKVIWAESYGAGYDWEALAKEIRNYEGAGRGDILAQINARLGLAEELFGAAQTESSQEKVKELMDECNNEIYKAAMYKSYFDRFGYGYRNR